MRWPWRMQANMWGRSRLLEHSLSNNGNWSYAARRTWYHVSCYDGRSHGLAYVNIQLKQCYFHHGYLAKNPTQLKGLGTHDRRKSLRHHFSRHFDCMDTGNWSQSRYIYTSYIIHHHTLYINLKCCLKRKPFVWLYSIDNKLSGPTGLCDLCSGNIFQTNKRTGNRNDFLSKHYQTILEPLL